MEITAEKIGERISLLGKYLSFSSTFSHWKFRCPGSGEAVESLIATRAMTAN
jgi:hypothetical protein